MENNKKKKIINSALAGILATSAIATTAAVLTSCNISISSGAGNTPEEDSNENPTNPNRQTDGFSTFITNKKQNDYEQLEASKSFDVCPQQSNVNFPGTNEKFKYSKDYAMGTKIFKDAVAQNKTRLTEIAKNLVINAVENSIDEQGKAELTPFVNITEKNGKFIVVYNYTYIDPSDRPDEVPPEDLEPEIPEQEIKGKNANECVRALMSLKDITEKQKEKPKLYLAFKYEFDFSNVRFDINEDSSLYAKGITWRGKMDYFGDVYDLPADLRLDDINNQMKYFNVHFPFLFHGNADQKIQEWNKSKMGNQGFLNGIKAKFKASAERKVASLKKNVKTIYDIFTELRTNDPTLRSFIFYLEPTISDLAESMNLHPALRMTIKDVLNPNVQLGTAKNPQPGTLYYDLKALKDAGVINGTIETVLKRIIFPKLKDKHPVDYILELPNTLAAMDQGAINTILNLLKLIARDLYNKIVAMGKKIDFVFQIFKNLMERAPNQKIGEIKVLDFISSDVMYGYWDYLINTLVPVLIKDPQKAQKIITMKNNFKPVLKQIRYDKNRLKNILRDLTNVHYKTKQTIGSNWKSTKPITKYFEENTSFSEGEQTITPNSDGQSFNVKLIYRLNFNLEVRIDMDEFDTMFNKVDVSLVAKALGFDKIPSGLEWLVDAIGNLGKAFPKNIHIMPGDYIEYRIEDPKAFIIPTQNGYSVKAKQYFKTSLQKSLDETYDSLKSRYKLWWPLVKKIANPIYYTLRNYYADSSYTTDFVANVYDPNNSFDLTQGVYDGRVIDNSPANLDSIRKNIIAPYVSVKENLQNSSKEFTLELQGDIKNRVLRQLGLDPNVYGNKSKFILTSKPGFAIKVKDGKLPGMSGITLDISFNTPILQKDSNPPVWVNEIKFTNL